MHPVRNWRFGRMFQRPVMLATLLAFFVGQRLGIGRGLERLVWLGMVVSGQVWAGIVSFMLSGLVK